MIWKSIPPQQNLGPFQVAFRGGSQHFNLHGQWENFKLFGLYFLVYLRKGDPFCTPLLEEGS